MLHRISKTSSESLRINFGLFIRTYYVNGFAAIYPMSIRGEYRATKIYFEETLGFTQSSNENLPKRSGEKFTGFHVLRARSADRTTEKPVGRKSFDNIALQWASRSDLAQSHKLEKETN
jgi:hypothetical protein